VGKITLYLNDKELYTSKVDAHVGFQGPLLLVHDAVPDQTSACVYAYLLRPGQYAQVQILDNETKINVGYPSTDNDLLSAKSPSKVKSHGSFSR
jgi:hypothetical protein